MVKYTAVKSVMFGVTIMYEKSLPELSLDFVLKLFGTLDGKVGCENGGVLHTPARADQSENRKY